MRLTTDDGEFSEVFIKGDKDSSFLVRPGKNVIISWINIPRPRPDDIVSCGSQRINGTTPDAGIEQKFHEADSRGRGSIRS
jgi:hypothetical protein